MTHFRCCLVAGFVLVTSAPAFCSAPSNRDDFSARIAPAFKKYCFDCHSGDQPEADLSLDQLAPDFSAGAETWERIFERLSDGSMPPEENDQPTAAERKALTQWIETGLLAAHAEAATHGRARLRRLSRIEYANTLRDLLGATIDIEALPEDGVASGFDNVDAALDLSPTLLECYLETADKALIAIFVPKERPELLQRHIDMVEVGKQKIYSGTRPRFGVNTEIREKDIVFFSEGQPDKIIKDTRVPEDGVYRFRISANAVRHSPNMTVILYAGTYSQHVIVSRLLDAFDVGDEPTVVTVTHRMKKNEELRLSPFGVPTLYKPRPDDYQGPGLAVQWIEVEGPIYDEWPPTPSAKILGDVDLETGTLADAEAILRRFLPRAFRRRVTDDDLAPFLELVKSSLEKDYTFEAALRLGLKAVLCSPDFLYVSTTPGKLNDFDLATRLSYFLWSSTPDDALLSLAWKKKLGQTDVLRREVERMLDDPKAAAFNENFTGQWLSLRNLTATVPDAKLYPDFDDLLLLSMPQETRLFFDEVLKNDLSVLEFIHSDWSMLNERLALHYGISGITGYRFRKVTLPQDSHRGGVLTHAAVLKVTANGTNTSPVTRGAWVLDRIMGTPSPPPPKNISAIEPDIRGAKTLREQLAMHRSVQSCATCHVHIDPPGNALENFDVIGAWQEAYRTDARLGGKRKEQRIGSRRVITAYKNKVDASDKLVDGRTFSNIDEFKQLILKEPDTIVRGMIERLLVYSTGHAIEFGDRAAVDAIMAELKPKNYGFRSMIHAVVQSSPFRHK